MCGWQRASRQVDVLMREGDRGRSQPQPQAQADAHGQAETDGQVGTWYCRLMLLYWPQSKVKHRREMWEGMG